MEKKPKVSYTSPLGDDEEDVLPPEEAVRMMVDQVFHQFGPQYNPEMREAVDKVLDSIPEDDSSSIGKMIIVASIINSAVIPILEIFGTDVVATLLGDMAGRYRDLGRSPTTH